MEERKEISPNKAARILGVHYTTVLRWIRENLADYEQPRVELRHIRINKLARQRYFLDRSEIETIANGSRNMF